jgi:hypothetical protein
MSGLRLEHGKVEAERQSDKWLDRTIDKVECAVHASPSCIFILLRRRSGQRLLLDHQWAAIKFMTQARRFVVIAHPLSH